MDCLPIVLPQDQIDQLMVMAEKGAKLTVDLEHQTVSAYPENIGFSFDVDPFRKQCMLNGLDDIGLTERHVADITAYEAKQKQNQVWL